MANSPKTINIVVDEVIVGMISPAVHLIIWMIGNMIVTVNKDKIYLSRSTSYDKLGQYHFSNHFSHQGRHNTTALGNVYHRGGGGHMLPIFTKSRFNSTSLQGDTYVDDVE